MSDNQPPVPNTTDEQEEPTVNKPLNAKERPKLSPVLALLAFVLTIALIYWIGVEFLVDAD